MQSQGSGVPESRYAMSYTHSALTGDTGADLYGHGPDTYVNVLQHQHIGHGSGGPGPSPTSHGLGLSSPGHQHPSKRSADNAGLNPKQDPMVGDVSMSTIGMGHSTMDEGPSAGQNGSQSKKTPPPNGKKTKGRVKIKMEFIDNKLRRYTTFSKRKTGIMKKAYELSTLTGTQVMLLVASETGHVYTFATRKLQPMITSEAGKALIQTCLNSPDPPSSTVDQRMSATGFEETELTYTLHDEDQKKDSASGEEDEAVSSDESRSNSPVSAELERSYSSEGSTEQVPRPANSTFKGSSGPGRGMDAFAAANSSQSQQQQQQYQLVVNGRNTNPPPVPNLAGLASLANLPGLSGLTGLTLPLPHGANLASLLASASLPGLSLLTDGVGGSSTCNLGNSDTNVSMKTAHKNLPQLISLAHLGAALHTSNNAKDTCNRTIAANVSDNAALNLQTTKEKKSAGRTRPNSSGKKKK